MRGANMSIVRCEVVEGFAAGVTGERAFGGALVVGFQVAIEVRLLGEALVAARTLVGFLTSVN